MLRSCLEDLYWSCIEEKYCYDETIANYNPDDDDLVDSAVLRKNGTIVSADNHNRNTLSPICSQPTADDEFRRTIQTNVPILAPEILAVFENSQIFQEHQPKLMRVATTRALSPGIHRQSSKMTKKLGETDEERLIKRLEGKPQFY